MAGHFAVNHSFGQYVLNGAGTNKVENYFFQLKRSIDGAHHHVSAGHLGRYLAEFDFRSSTRTTSPTPSGWTVLWVKLLEEGLLTGSHPWERTSYGRPNRNE